MIFVVILLLVFFLVWLFFTATTTLCLARLGKTRGMEVIEKHEGPASYYRFHKRVYSSYQVLIFSGQIAQNLAHLALAGLTVFGVIQVLHLQWGWNLLILAVVLLLTLLAGSFFPRLLAMTHADKGLGFTQNMSAFFLYLSLPLSWPFISVASLVKRRSKGRSAGDPLEAMKETVVHILESANTAEKLSAADEKLIESVVKFKDRIVREVMVPRVDLFSLPTAMSIREAAKKMYDEGFSRTPIYRETVDNIIGILMFKDILELYMECEEGSKPSSLLDGPIETIAKGVFYTPETKKVAHLLQEFRVKSMHMAIVVDEYGGTEGVVTLEDILEEIVGEIADEYDIGDEMLYTTAPGGGAWIVDARMSIFDAEDIFGIQIPQEGEYDTIGGYIFHKVGSIPEKGVVIEDEFFEMEILHSSERSVEKVRITSKQESDT